VAKNGFKKTRISRSLSIAIARDESFRSQAWFISTAARANSGKIEAFSRRVTFHTFVVAHFMRDPATFPRATAAHAFPQKTHSAR
jgi:hypothetical protein